MSQSKWEKKRDEARDASLHFRPECEGFRCGAHRSWNEGADWARAYTIKEAEEILVKTLELIEKTPAVTDVEIAICKAAFVALKAWHERCGK